MVPDFAKFNYNVSFSRSLLNSHNICNISIAKVPQFGKNDEDTKICKNGLYKKISWLLEGIMDVENVFSKGIG